MRSWTSIKRPTLWNMLFAISHKVQQFTDVDDTLKRRTKR